MAEGRPYRKLQRSLTWLETFVSIVETGSLDAAAAHLGVARSVVSEHLRALEDALTGGAELIERGPGKRVRLTTRGERLFAAVVEPIHQLSLDRLRFIAAEEASVRVGMAPTLSHRMLEAIAEGLAKRGIKLEAAFGDAKDLVREIETRQLDLALGFTPLPPYRGVQVEVLATLPFVVMAPLGSSLGKRQSNRKSLRVEHLDGEPFVDWVRDDPYGGANAARFSHASVTVRERARVESYLQLFPVLRAYDAFAIGPDLRALDAFPADIGVWALKEEAPQTVDVVALLPADGVRDEARLCLDVLRGVIQVR